MKFHIPCPVSSIAGNHPRRLAVVTPERMLSYSDLDGRLQSVALQLKRAGFKRGDRLALRSENSLECLLVLLAALRSGIIAFPVNPRLPPKTVATVIEQTGSREIALSLLENSVNTAVQSETEPIDLAQPATIILTSGSSGLPKAALLTCGNHHFSALGANENLPVIKSDRWLLSLPLYHVSGLAVVFRTFCAGAAIVLPGKNTEIPNAVAEHGITHVSMVPTQLYRLLKNISKIKKLRNLKVILLGGGPIAGALLEKAAEHRLPVYTTYGMTEMASQIATGTRAMPLHLSILPYRQVKISGENEIWVRGETLFAGYVTKKGVQRPFTPDGWFPTGDTGVLDEHGRLTVIGRKDNMFVSGGENIYPEEIEKVLAQLAAIERAVVVPCEDAEFGARPAAFLKWNGQTPAELSRVAAYLSECLPAIKIPVSFYEWPESVPDGQLKTERRFFGELVRTGSGTLKRLS